MSHMIIPMTNEYASAISHWRYENEYSVYSFEPDDETLREPLNGDYYAFLDEDDILLGFFCYGKSARIPKIEEDVYDELSLDIGLGMMPEQCGRGNGYSFVKAGLQFAQQTLKKRAFRLTVASFNARAICVYEKIGFRITQTVTHRKTGSTFYLMALEGA